MPGVTVTDALAESVVFDGSDRATVEAEARADAAGVSGPDRTPFVLAAIADRLAERMDDVIEGLEDYCERHQVGDITE